MKTKQIENEIQDQIPNTSGIAIQLGVAHQIVQ